MSEVYSIEPKTHGKVIIYTSLGELEIHLFSNECPEACRNFIQHCLNNYYNKNEFFRVIPRFLIQTGDHTNTGLHNEYAFSSPFKNEYNSRLKFLYTGCLSFANLNIDKPSNGSQFFITLDKAEYLNNKNTLFGKVAKHSIYNLLKFNNIKTNKHDKPIEDIPYIEYVKIIENPFHHLVPSINYEYNTKNQNVKDKNEYLNKTKKKKEQNLLSFDYDQEISDDSETFFRGDKDQTVKQKNVSSYDKFGNVEDNKGEDDKGEDDKGEDNKGEDNKGEDNKGEDDKGEDIKGEDIKGEDIKRDEKNNKTTEDKINTLKKRTCDIENSNRKKNKTSSSIKDIINMDEEYLKNMKKYNKMSKKEREKLSLKKLQDFDNRLKDLFSRENNEESTKHNWLNKSGLKFHIDSSNAYEYEDVKKNMVDTMEREKKNSYHSKYKTEKYLKQKNEFK
ncbi:peptidyl-prolyl cis-trans isomerase [Plasmodium falciparum NF54]|uniref:Peptidyl-prolyl cis-trans isomerase n=2 Tax=Plasmodium falciparum TaxID=5833 RepID=Q8ILM0_PLAF7|nr:peptidyl-prolyl cis-trans isomerase [Plasmodium falciparum 3D7]KAF4329365.1 peptidyl-prolyl cis-trans isomerase [Plasmodium falciparum NF54]PKC49588.1 peptidyl-prolyl cis-trans isomerase [Plasmodium falciparum NF54]CZT99938.1 peptidyl-prolyl cis-trans isomerase [Plasmodium falciparum 3D7]|eukprot:XP_001348397.2 peptidyl-prolyl cis-trans isomerase [Plasmodium falciparum 3D7]